MDALAVRAAAVLARADSPWPARWDGLAAVVADLSSLVLAGPGARVAAQALAEVLVAEVSRDREHRAALAGLVDRVVDLHVVACLADPPDGRELAAWLLWLQTGFAEPPEVRLAPYAPVLGEDGVAFYREQAVARFERLPVIGYGRPGRYDRERWALLRVVEELAEHTGDVDLQVLVLARDLSSGWHYLRVATVLRDAGRSAEAVEWVRRGLAATGGRGAAARLADLGVDECLRLGRVEQAVELRRAVFLASPGVESYTRLRGLAAAVGDWPALRDDVLARVGDDVLRLVVEVESGTGSDGPVPEWVARLRADLAGRGP